MKMLAWTIILLGIGTILCAVDLSNRISSIENFLKPLTEAEVVDNIENQDYFSGKVYPYIGSDSVIYTTADIDIDMNYFIIKPTQIPEEK